MKLATAGICDYRVCFSKGCQKAMCHEHAHKEDTDEADDFMKHRVCVECESRANRAFWITILIVLLVPLMAALPAIILYGGEGGL